MYKPVHDNRYRTHTSVLAWVVTRHDIRGKPVFGIQSSIERVLWRIEGKEGKFVVCDSSFYPLHSVEMFEHHRELALNGMIHFYSNYSGIGMGQRGIEDIVAAPFIYEHEAGERASGYWGASELNLKCAIARSV